MFRNHHKIIDHLSADFSVICLLKNHLYYHHHHQHFSIIISSSSFNNFKSYSQSASHSFVIVLKISNYL